MRLYEGEVAKRWLAASILFGAGALAIWVYVTFLKGVPETAFGQRWTGIEITLFRLPSGSIPGVPKDVSLPLQFKPITGFTFLAFLWFASAFQSLRLQLESMSRFKRDAIMVVAFLFCLVTGYEFIWNFTIWSAKLAYLGVTSLVPFNELVDATAWESFYYPVNLVFITKIFGCAFFMAIYTIYYLHQMQAAEK